MNVTVHCVTYLQVIQINIIIIIIINEIFQAIWKFQFQLSYLDSAIKIQMSIN